MFSWRRSNSVSNPVRDKNTTNNNTKFEVIDVNGGGMTTSSIMSDSMISSFSSCLSEDQTIDEANPEEEPSTTPLTSYCGEWEKIFGKPGYLKSLKSGAMRGDLRSSRYRSICWKLFLEVLPESLTEWSEKTIQWRNKYEDLKNQLVVNPRGVEVKDLSINNPLSQEVQSPWNQFFLDNELRLTIKQDVIRTFPDVAFYNDSTIQDHMVNILFCYARTHSDVIYKQGMHELLAPLIFILHCDHQAFLHACDIEPVGELTRQILDPQYLEHDAYALFYQIMETMEPCYVSKEIPPAAKTGASMQAQPFIKLQDLQSSNVIVTKLTRIQDYLLKRFDPELYEHLQKMDIAPQIYGIRWVRLLFGREFPMQDLLMLWDAIFADSISFDLIDYIFLAMLLYLRKAMLTSDYPSCLHLLMKYPPVSDIQYFIDKALFLRDPHEYPSVSDYLYQKPANFGLNGWEYVPSYTHCPQTSQSVTSPMSDGRRPVSLIIGSNKMYKSNSEPMNLITDIAPSPGVSEISDYGEKTRRKGSTVSLSQIETSLMKGMVALQQRGAGPMHSSYHTTGVEYGGAGDSGVNTSPRNGSKFFVFGARAGRKSSMSNKQRQSVTTKNYEQEAMRALGCIADMETMCKRCANELDVHIGTLQTIMLKKEINAEDDEILLALAGVKQVRDVLKGVLKASSVFDSPESQLNQESENSRRRAGASGGQTPLTEGDRGSQGKYYLATPDLLSSDTDVTSPDDPIMGAEECFEDDGRQGLMPLTKSERNLSNDTIVPKENTIPESDGNLHGYVGNYYSANLAGNREENPMNGNSSIDSSGTQYNGNSTRNTGNSSRGSISGRNSTELSRQTSASSDKDGARLEGATGGAWEVEMGLLRESPSRPPLRAVEGETKENAGVARGSTERSQRRQSQERMRDPSPINKLTDMFKSFAKF